MTPPPATQSVRWMTCLAASLPSLLAYNEAPSPTFLNQALAFELWALCALAAAPALAAGAARPLLAALVLLAAAAAWSWGPGGLPASLALSSLGTLAAAALLCLAGAGTRARGDNHAQAVFAAFCWAWLLAGVFNALVALIQVFAPGATGSNLIATSGLPGRAVGNLRQPNHLSSLLLWSCIAVVALCELKRLRLAWAAGLMIGLIFCVVLTASRTGFVSVLALAAWGVLDRRLARQGRWLLVAALVVYGLSWLGMAGWAQVSQHTFGGAKRLDESALGGSRLAILIDTLALIRQQPWWGVGFGEFNFAWSLTPLPQRPSPFFDHTHNLPLQWVVELGVPLALLVLGLLGWSLWRAARLAWRASDVGLGVAQRCACLMVCMIGLHSLVEYPLWYSYFLLPAAWAWGFALGPSPPVPRPPWRGATASGAPVSYPLAAAAVLMFVGTLLAVVDYTRVVRIFRAGPDAAPLEERIRAGQRSVFFGHHADYAAVTSGLTIRDPAHAFDRVTHYLLDTRLMIAWSKSLAERGEIDAARHVAARLREFKKEDAAEFFAPCAAAVHTSPVPFQCSPPSRPMHWREFMTR
jgi:Virulence factor membrane-bound polymerase, C-terminal/O-Antigen ligase/Protein glycosylation ligase